MNSETPQIKSLRNRYKGTLTEKAEIIEQHLQSLLDVDEPQEIILIAIRDDLHKFAGSLGMYGYDDIADVAREGMKMVDEGNQIQLHHTLINLRDLLSQHANS